MIEKATGLILRTRPLTDTSLIVHWLTPELGRIATVAKGARRPKSPFAGKLDLFYLADFSFQRSRHSELHLLREATLRKTHPELRRDMERLEQAAYCAALIEQTTEAETPIQGIYALMTGLLEHLTQHPPLPQTLLAFEMKLLGELGLQPDLEKEPLKPDLRQILKDLSTRKWSTLPRLKLTKPQIIGLDRYLRNYLVYHLGKVPGSRIT